MRLLASVVVLSLLVCSAWAEPVSPFYAVTPLATVSDPGEITLGGGYVYVLAGQSTGAATVRRFFDDGTPVPFAVPAMLNPVSIAAQRGQFFPGPYGTVIFASTIGNGGRLTAMYPGGTTATLVESAALSNPGPMCFAGIDGSLLIASRGTGEIMRYSGASQVSTVIAAESGTTVQSMAYASSVGATIPARLVVGRSDGTIKRYYTNFEPLEPTFATGVLLPMTIVQPGGIDEVFGNDVYVFTGEGELRRYTAPGTYTTVGAGFGTVRGAEYYGAGVIYVSSATENRLYRVSCLSASISEQAVYACSDFTASRTVTALAAPGAQITYRWQAKAVESIGSTDFADLSEGGSLTVEGVTVGTVTGVSSPTLTLVSAPFVGNDAASNNWRAEFRCLVSAPCGSAELWASALWMRSADVGKQGGTYGHDGVHNNNDFIVFIDLYFAHDSRADLGTSGGILGADGFFDNNDFIAFIDLFFEHCER